MRRLGQELKRSQAQGEDEATIEFVARSKQGGRAHRLHEISRFAYEGGRWYYVESEPPQPKRTAKSS